MRREGFPDIQRLKELKQNRAQRKKALLEKLGKSIMGFGFNLTMKSKSISYDKKRDNISLPINDLLTKDEV